ncbi:MAG: hypothetical protein R3323_07310, partial [Wenzhouxiangellaceae bacterium]|nr:hypothetical protein [Wenzhouxiangellaceae bacterium]
LPGRINRLSVHGNAVEHRQHISGVDIARPELKRKKRIGWVLTGGAGLAVMAVALARMESAAPSVDRDTVQMLTGLVKDAVETAGQDRRRTAHRLVDGRRHPAGGHPRHRPRRIQSRQPVRPLLHHQARRPSTKTGRRDRPAAPVYAGMAADRRPDPQASLSS